jgi:hypothetical protein
MFIIYFYDYFHDIIATSHCPSVPPSHGSSAMFAMLSIQSLQPLLAPWLLERLADCTETCVDK